MRCIMKKAILVLSIVIIMLGLPGCTHLYRGQQKELYTAAIYSIPNARGYMVSEVPFDPDIYVWEQDDYGRTLFSYCEDFSNRVFALVLCQAYDKSNVYFYPDVNYVLLLGKEDGYYKNDKDYLKTRTKAFYLENRDKIKEDNDWNKPIDKNKCVSYSITNHKGFGEKVTSLRQAQCNEILKEYLEKLKYANPSEGSCNYKEILQVDAEGKVLYHIRGVYKYFDNPDWKMDDKYTSYEINLWVITDKDGNYDKEKGILVIPKANVTNSTYVYDANAVLEFKNKNNWKYAYCEP